MVSAKSYWLVGVFSLVTVWHAGVQAKTDPDTGMLIAPGWEITRAHCTACHSARLVTQNGGDREAWADIIKWMQDTQGLWVLDDATLNTILTYLSENYGAGARPRRAALADHMLPVNPYKTK